MKKSKTNILFAGKRSNTLVGVLFAVLIASIVLLFVNFFYMSTQSKYGTEYVRQAGELRILSQRIAKNAAEAATGTPEAFGLLREARDDFQKRWGYLTNGNPSQGLPAAPAEVSVQMQAVKQSWDALRQSTDVILEQEHVVLSLHQTAVNLTDVVPQIQGEYDAIVNILFNNNADAFQVAMAQRQTLLAERMWGSLNRLLSGEDTEKIADKFVLDAALFGRTLKAMREGDKAMDIAKVTDADAVKRLAKVTEYFAVISTSVQDILRNAPELQQVRTAANGIFDESQLVLRNASELTGSLEKLAGGKTLNALLGYALSALVLGSIILIGMVAVRGSNRRLIETAEANDRNQAAILRLLDEIADLADGDLTVQATVTEDFTGAIADSINYSIDQLRELVQTINKTAVQVAGAAEQTQATAMHLAEASEHQAQEIAGASAAINEMAMSIDQVSTNAAESSSVAERSVTIANTGNEVVHNTITGMDKIREQIQDTSKRIKRLGESSQEIGDIVSLINDIADQTNILALNAAIQASMAGDAGRGFAVVADEVQRLAERSSAATKQIEALVKTIQTDTNEAVISMEQTTSEVVRGAHLAQDAGVALEEIEKVSKSLAALIQSISNAARQQASSASHISNTMNVIQEITSQTSSGTTATARSIGSLAKMATEMRKSVSGFNLPESESV